MSISVTLATASGLARRPDHPDRPAEVVEDEVHPLDPERRQRLADEGRVAGVGVLEARRGDGLAEVGQVEGDRPHPGLPTAPTSRAQSSAEPGLPCRKTTASLASAGPACTSLTSVPATLNRPRSAAAIIRARPSTRPPDLPRAHASRGRGGAEMTVVARGSVPANIRAGPIWRVANLSKTTAASASSAAAAKRTRSIGLKRRPVA